jgi:serine protease Do
MRVKGPRRTATGRRPRATPTVNAFVLLSVLLSVLFLPVQSGAQPARTPEERAAELVQPAMVYIETSWAAWVNDHDGDWLNDGYPYEWTTSCSGFVVNPSGYIVTAGHCVDAGLDHGASWDAILYGVDEWIERGWAEPRDADGLLDVAYGTWLIEGEGAGTPPDRTVFVAHGRAVSGLAAGTAWPARVVEVLSLNQGDVALLKVEETDLPTIQLATDAAIGIGASVLSVGYPASSDVVTDQTLEPTFKDGRISSQRTREGGLLPVYEVSSALTGGMSGGPTVDLDGRVIGVNSFSAAGEVQQFNFLTPVSLVAEMLNRNGVSNESGPIDELYATALDAYFDGDYAAAVDGFAHVLDRVPSHQRAQELRSRAATLRDQDPAPVDVAGDDAWPWALLAGVAGGLIVLAAAAWLVVRSRTRKRSGTPQEPVPAPSTPEVSTGPGAAESGWTPPGWHEPTVPEPTVSEPPFGSTDTPAGWTAPRTCPYCASENEATARFCADCGRPLVHPASPTTT